MDWRKTLIEEEPSFEDYAENAGRKLSYVAALYCFGRKIAV